MPLREAKIAPVFFIGLGGCGGAIVDELARKVKQEESYERYSGLIHFFALDTDADDLARLHWVDNAHKFVLSDFDKPEYVALKQGKLHAPADPLFTQWWPEYYRPRATRGKGAGQIRLESRLSFYHHLENDSGKILETFEKAIRRAYDVHNPFRANTAAKIYIYASLAGGTGSGGFAMVATTVRKLLGGQRGHLMIGTFVLPNVFKSKGLPPNQFHKVMANGYSSLQEMELLQTATADLPIEFHFDPDHPEYVHVDRPPFDQIYLIEEKTAQGTVIADAGSIYNAIADAAHAQIFSTILHKEGSTLDNDTRELMQHDDQMFTKSFGSFGISALVLPDEDVLEYCALRLATELLVGAIPGGVDALGDGTDINAADEAFADGLEDRATGSGEDAELFKRAVVWAKGGDGEGEGVLDGFIRRCNEDVAKDVGQAVKLRDWDEAELSSFEKDPERVQSELNSAWTALKSQLVKSDDAAKRRGQRAATEVISGSGAMSLSDLTRGRGPMESRYLYIRLHELLQQKQDETRKEYDRGLSMDNDQIHDEFRRRVDQLKEAAPEKLLEKLPGRENDYFSAASEFANWYRETLGQLRRRVRANAMLEFYSVVMAELQRRREASIQFFARIDRVRGVLEDRAQKLLAEGAERVEGGEANLFVLDVEVLQDHRTGSRLWDHLYLRTVTAADFQLSGALGRLADLAEGGGAERDIQRRIVDALLDMASTQLRPRIAGSRDSRGLDLAEMLKLEARLVSAGRELLKDGPLPPPADPGWEEEMKRVTDDAIEAYIKDKLDFAASKCQPFITLGAGAPYLPDKAYCVLDPVYAEALSDHLADLKALKFDKGQIINGEDPHQIVFYKSQLGCALHAIKSLGEYERRYFSVKQSELAEGGKVPGLPDGVPQIPLHQDANWEGAPDAGNALFRISIEGVQAGESKLAWFERFKTAAAATQKAEAESDDLKDFTMGLAFGHIDHQPEGPAGEGFYLGDEDLSAEDRLLGRFRDRAFATYCKRTAAQRKWVRAAWQKSFGQLHENREAGKLAELFDAHLASIEAALKNAHKLGGDEFATHVRREKEATLAFRKEKGV